MVHSADPLKHLRKDKKLSVVIDAIGPITDSKDSDLYFLLLRAIVGQQLSTKAAATIWARFLNLFNDKYPEAQLIIQTTTEKFRSVGLSYQKASYIRNIAEFSLAKTLESQLLELKSDEELISYLTTIKGVGRWTVEMILMFSLNRPDVFPKNDLGIRKGMAQLYSLDESDKKGFLKSLENIAKKWSPYRTLACKYIWRYKDL
jgi:DNA-3-methyladenine glycosylase II